MDFSVCFLFCKIYKLHCLSLEEPNELTNIEGLDWQKYYSIIEFYVVTVLAVI